MSTATKMTYLLETKNQIKNAIQNKGVSISNTDSFRSYANKISQIEGSGSTSTSDWQPEPDWWDIDTILENDTEEYTSKAIFLLTNELDDSNVINEIGGFSKYETSDGQVIEQTTTLNLNSLFNINADKTCKKGYKTRYIIAYSNSNNIYHNSIPCNSLYMIFKNINFNYNCFRGRKYLKSIKFINSKLDGETTNNMFDGCCSLEYIEGLNMSDVTSMNYMFNDCYALKKIKILNTSNVINMNSSFNDCRTLRELEIDTRKATNMSMTFFGCYSLEKIEGLDTSNTVKMNNIFSNCNSLHKIDILDTNKATTISNAFSGCELLNNINNITKIEESISFSSSEYLNHATLIRILNALSDQTGQTTLKLTLGSINIAKLTDEEKAIATEKNWTLA